MTEYRFSDVCQVVNGRAYSQNELLNIGKYRVLRVGNFFSSDRWYYSDLELDDDKYCYDNDLLFAWSCSFGPRIWKGDKTIYHYHIWKLIPNENIVDKKYLYYWLLVSVKSLTAGNHGSVMGHMTKGEMEKQRITLPDLETQKKIASILSSIDDAIETNTRINENLEQQAQTIYKQWKERHSDEGCFVTLDEVCSKITDGSHYSPKDDLVSKIPMFSVKDMEKYDFDFSKCKHISLEDFRIMENNDCVPKIDDILVAKDGSYLKEIFICNKNRSIAILSSIAIFRPNPRVIFPEILLSLLKSPEVFNDVRDNYVSGSALPRIVLKDFKKLKFRLPYLLQQKEIADILSSIRFSIDGNIELNRRLVALRDNLLPRLMSGEIKV